MPTITGRLRTPQLSAAPSSPVVGEMYYDTATNQLKWWDGTSWQIAGGSSAPTIYDTDPIGTVKTFTGKTLPQNWVLADGSTYAEASYPDLATFAAAEVAAGNPLWGISGVAPARTITIPDLRRRMLYGSNSPSLADIGASGGEETHVLSIAELPSHNHGGATGYDNSDHSHNMDHDHPLQMSASYGTAFQPGSGSGTVVDRGGGGSGSPVKMFNGNTGGRSSQHTHNIGLQGSGTAHNTLPPYILVAVIIKIKGAAINAGGALQGATGPVGPKGDSGGATYTTTIGDGSTTVFTVTHNLNSTDAFVAVRETASPYSFVYPEIRYVDTMTVQLIFDVAPATNAYRVSVIIGGAAGLPVTGAAGGDLTGTYPNPQIAAGVIVNADISGSAFIKTGKLDWQWSATPPVGPALLDSWLYPLSTGGFWHFVWDGSYWAFVGGPPLFGARVNSAIAIANGSWTEVLGGACPAIPRNGEYLFEAKTNWTFQPGSGKIALGVDGAAYDDNWWFSHTTAGYWAHLVAAKKFTALTAGQIPRIWAQANAGGMTLTNATLAVTPIRVT